MCGSVEIVGLRRGRDVLRLRDGIEKVSIFKVCVDIGRGWVWFLGGAVELVYKILFWWGGGLGLLLFVCCDCKTGIVGWQGRWRFFFGGVDGWSRFS